MFFVIGDEIIHRESIMGCYEVDALFGFAIPVSIDVGAGKETFGEDSCLFFVTLDECTHIITKSAIPFLPVVSEEISDLIKPCCIPGLGDQFGSTEHGIGLDIPKDGWIRFWVPVDVTGQH